MQIELPRRIGDQLLVMASSYVDSEKMDVKLLAVEEAGHPARRSALVGSPDKHRPTPTSECARSRHPQKTG